MVYAPAVAIYIQDVVADWYRFFFREIYGSTGDVIFRYFLIFFDTFPPPYEKNHKNGVLLLKSFAYNLSMKTEDERINL